MGTHFNGPFCDLAVDRWQDIARHEPALRAAAGRWLFRALVSRLRRAVQ